MLANRANDRDDRAMRDVKLTRGIMKNANGSCLAEFGDTRVLCTATIEDRAPSWRKGSGKGWLTAEYAMLPAAGNKRTRRETNGGTRTAAITGAWVAAYDAFEMWKTAGRIKTNPLFGQVAAISVGLVEGRLMLDLDYEEDSNAEIDMNVVMNAKGEIVEIQGTGEQVSFSRDRLNEFLDVAEEGIKVLLAAQKDVLGIE